MVFWLAFLVERGRVKNEGRRRGEENFICVGKRVKMRIPSGGYGPFFWLQASSFMHGREIEREREFFYFTFFFLKKWSNTSFY